MNKIPTTVYIQVDVNDKLPTERGDYSCIDSNYKKDELLALKFYPYNKSWINDEMDERHPQYWLKPLTASIVLSVEEYEKLKEENADFKTNMMERGLEISRLNTFIEEMMQSQHTEFELVKSALSIAKRKGEQTNWDGFIMQCEKALDKSKNSHLGSDAV